MNIPVNFVKLQSTVSEEKFFEGSVYGCTHARTDGRTHDGHNAMTIARWPSASGAKNVSYMHLSQLAVDLSGWDWVYSLNRLTILCINVGKIDFLGNIDCSGKNTFLGKNLLRGRRFLSKKKPWTPDSDQPQ